MRRKNIQEVVDDICSGVHKIDDKEKIYIPTGSTMLDLALSGNILGGYVAGRVVNLIGDSSAGKTYLGFSVFAEMCKEERFDGYRLNYDDVEQALGFDITRLFGVKTAERVIPPNVDDAGLPRYSSTIQYFAVNISRAIEKGEPFVYVLDSFDGLTSSEEMERTEGLIEAVEKGKDIKGTYGMEKPKMMGQILRQITPALEKTQSLLIVISQTRDNINPMSFTKKVRSGGRALQFFSAHEIWLAVVEKIKDPKWKRTIATTTRAKISKNKITGKLSTVDFTIYNDYGVDDIRSCIQFLIYAGAWSKSGQKINTHDFADDMTENGLIRYIEENNKIGELKKLVAEKWAEIEESLVPDRVPRYV